MASPIVITGRKRDVIWLEFERSDDKNSQMQTLSLGKSGSCGENEGSLAFCLRLLQ